jgi:N-acetylglutamate synthase-like GNAT family acetyltransferase
MLRQAQTTDLEALKNHLSAAKLVLQSIEEHLEHFWLLFDKDKLIASAGLEIYGRVALLRSVAVNANRQGQGLGQKILRQTFEYASSLGIQELVLLTETAPSYFERYGFEVIARENAPQAVKASTEFKGACSESAIVMRYVLPNQTVFSAFL